MFLAEKWPTVSSSTSKKCALIKASLLFPPAAIKSTGMVGEKFKNRSLLPTSSTGKSHPGPCQWTRLFYQNQQLYVNRVFTILRTRNTVLEAKLPLEFRGNNVSMTLSLKTLPYLSTLEFCLLTICTYIDTAGHPPLPNPIRCSSAPRPTLMFNAQKLVLNCWVAESMRTNAKILRRRDRWLLSSRLPNAREMGVFEERRC